MRCAGDNLNARLEKCMLFKACEELRSGVAAILLSDVLSSSRWRRIISTHWSGMDEFADRSATGIKGCANPHVVDFAAAQNDLNACFAKLM